MKKDYDCDYCLDDTWVYYDGLVAGTEDCPKCTESFDSDLRLTDVLIGAIVLPVVLPIAIPFFYCCQLYERFKKKENK